MEKLRQEDHQLEAAAAALGDPVSNKTKQARKGGEGGGRGVEKKKEKEGGRQRGRGGNLPVGRSRLGACMTQQSLSGLRSLLPLCHKLD